MKDIAAKRLGMFITAFERYRDHSFQGRPPSNPDTLFLFYHFPYNVFARINRHRLSRSHYPILTPSTMIPETLPDFIAFALSHLSGF